MKNCYIVGAGTFGGMLQNPGSEDLLIAADGGYLHLKAINLDPQVLIGDFDSLGYVPEHDKIIQHSPIKDDTDMALAVAYAEEQECQKFYLYGGLGGRLDHTFANIQLLTRLSRKHKEAYLIGEGQIMTVLTNERIAFSKRAEGIISAFSLSERCSGVNETGLKYTLENADISFERALGVSNEFTGESASVSLKEGSMLLTWELKDGFPIGREVWNMAEMGGIA